MSRGIRPDNEEFVRMLADLAKAHSVKSFTINFRQEGPNGEGFYPDGEVYAQWQDCDRHAILKASCRSRIELEAANG